MKLKLLVLVLALQTAWLLATVANQEFALSHGKIILLETHLVGPYDMLRGDYLILNYKISDVPATLFVPPVKNDLVPGTKIFVALALGTNQFYEITRVSTNEFTPAPDEVLMRGRSDYRLRNATNSIHLTYGIENYFVPEGSGNPLGKLTVQAIVPASGRARIKNVFLNGKPFTQAMKGEKQQ